MTTRILIADDHEMMRDGLRTLLAQESGLEVVAEAGDGREALRLAQEVEPDLVVMDISMPGLNGIDATRQMTSRVPGTKVLCLSMHADPALVEGVMEAGANGYQLKDSPIQDLVRAIAAVMRGEIYYCPRIAARAERAARRTGRPDPALPHPTSREREVLQLIAEGHTNREIARLLSISVKTVGAHREHVMEKLDLHTIAGLTKYAIRQGLTSTEP